MMKEESEPTTPESAELELSQPVSKIFRFSPNLTLESVREMQDKFVEERDWQKFGKPRNLVLALMGEVGEMSALFQWKGECSKELSDWSAKEKKHLGEELSDIFIYLEQLAQQCNVDLPVVVEEKMKLNALKYPAELVYGSCKKYTEYKSKMANGDA